MDQGFSASLPVFAAAGSVEDCVLKYAPNGQPSQQALRYWQAERPGDSRVAFAVRPGIRWRVPPNFALSLPLTCASPQLSGMAG